MSGTRSALGLWRSTLCHMEVVIRVGITFKHLILPMYAPDGLKAQVVKNKAQVWVFEALQEIMKRVPFVILGIDSDNVLTSKSTLLGEETLPWHVLCDEALP